MTDVPSPIDLRREADARAWADTAMLKRPWRDRFFSRIVEEILGVGLKAPSVLELGSGPGFLARRALTGIPDSGYVALDFSPPMHRLAKERLGAAGDRVRFLTRDFSRPDWSVDLAPPDVVVSVQSVHELRHKRHAPALYRTVRSFLKQDGIFLVCDHLAGDGGMDNRSLYMTRAEHKDALRSGGFASVDLLLEDRGLILFRASGCAA